MKQKILQDEKGQDRLYTTREEGAASEALRKARRWRKASDLLLAAANNCIHGMKKSEIKTNGLDVQAFWLGPTLFVTILGFDPPGKQDPHRPR